MPIKNVKDVAKFIASEAKANGVSRSGIGQGLRQLPGLFIGGAKVALKSQARQLGARFVRGTVGRLLGNHQPGKGYPSAKKSQAAARSALRKSVARSARSR